MIVRTGDLGELTFSQVWPIFIEEKKQEVGPKTIRGYKEYFRALNPFFGMTLLRDIHTRPLGSWKTAWYSLRKEAGKRYPKLANVRMYDLRHHALTTLLENPNISERTIMDIAGHVSRKMLERYSHIRLQRKRAALDALESLRKAPGTILQFVPPKQSVH